GIKESFPNWMVNRQVFDIAPVYGVLEGDRSPALHISNSLRLPTPDEPVPSRCQIGPKTLPPAKRKLIDSHESPHMRSCLVTNNSFGYLVSRVEITQLVDRLGKRITGLER